MLTLSTHAYGMLYAEALRTSTRHVCAAKDQPRGQQSQWQRQWFSGAAAWRHPQSPHPRGALATPRAMLCYIHPAPALFLHAPVLARHAFCASHFSGFWGQH